MGSVCHGYMSILLYIKLVLCSGFPEFYARLEEGVESVCHGYMSILLYMKLIWCSGFQRSMLNWRSRQWQSVCHGYMSILLYMKLICCSGFPEIYAQLKEGVESVCHGYMSILLYMKLIWCSGFQRSMLNWRTGGGVSLPWVYVHSAIYESYVV